MDDEKMERLRLACESEARRDERQRRLHRRVITFAVALGLAAAGVVGCLARTVATQPISGEVEAAPDIWATDGTGTEPVARPMQGKPFEGQKTPPCNGKFEVAHNGGCWVPIKGTPGTDACGPSYFAKDGECFLPVKRAARPPTSVDP